MNIQRQLHVLLVEDNPGDVRLTEEAFKELDSPNTLCVLQDGVEAVLYLKRQGKYKNAVRPDLILLDLHLPRKTGLETLAEIKNDPALRAIPVIMLTTSEEKEDVLKAYDLQVNGYINKPLDMGQYIDTIRQIISFWSTNTNLPPEGITNEERRSNEYTAD